MEIEYDNNITIRFFLLNSNLGAKQQFTITHLVQDNSYQISVEWEAESGEASTHFPLPTF